MAQHIGEVTYHVKRRGKIRHCRWCGQEIRLRERYAKWLYYDGGTRSTVYAHAECATAWTNAATSEGGVVYAVGDYDRPPPLDNPAKPA